MDNWLLDAEQTLDEMDKRTNQLSRLRDVTERYKVHSRLVHLEIYTFSSRLYHHNRYKPCYLIRCSRVVATATFGNISGVRTQTHGRGEEMQSSSG